jgi:hypothetical protein
MPRHGCPGETRLGQSPLHRFVTQLQRDEAAIRAALTLPWDRSKDTFIDNRPSTSN